MVSPYTDTEHVQMALKDNKPKILICDDELSFHQAVKHALKDHYEVKSTYNSNEAIAVLKNQNFEIALLDLNIQTEKEGFTLIPVIREFNPSTSIIIISATTDFQTIREAMRLGAYDYISKDFKIDELLHALKIALEHHHLNRKSRQKDFESVQIQKKYNLIGKSKKIEELRKKIAKIQLSQSNVLITGETGSGKEIVARLLRAQLEDGSLAPFVAVDSSTIQNSMAESILFGYEKGSFTGAEKNTPGLFEEAQGGIIYFDEIANMPLEIQSKLLRVLQEKEIRRVGSAKVIEINFRVVCATNRSLEKMVQDHLFKDDLFQRLNVLPIEIPPLRERTEDIPLLIEHFLKNQSSPKLYFSDSALEKILHYSWPGNVRELQNFIAYLITFMDGDQVEDSHLPKRFLAKATSPSYFAQSSSFYDRVNQFESQILKEEYTKNEGNITRLAQALKMDRSHLYTKLREYQIHESSKREC